MEQELNQSVKQAIKFAPMIKNLFDEDIMISIADRESVVFNILSNDVNMPDSTGFKLTTKDPVYRAIHDNKRLSLTIPKEAYGIPSRIVITPIHDEQQQVRGAISLISSVEKQENLVQVAEQLASSSEEISASTSEMSSSATDLNGHMSNLMNAHSDMTKQMLQTEKMLELINSIAQSSRILGLNAGIEAARSGEHGRGFSIVAKEITKLADRSQDSVEQIRQLLNTLKEKVDHVALTVAQTVEISEHQSTAISEISEAISHLATVAESIENLSKKM